MIENTVNESIPGFSQVDVLGMSGSSQTIRQCNWWKNLMFKCQDNNV